MDFSFSERVEKYRENLLGFMESDVFPGEESYARQMEESGDPHHHPQIVEDLKKKARALGLWNLFLPDDELGAGLAVHEYAPLAEITGWSPWLAPEALNCSAPDTGNMEILHMFGTPDQKEEWLAPLLDGEIRSCFSMTEPAVASSDATNIETSMVRDGDSYVINGRKWFSSGAASPRCKFSIVMGVTNPDGDPHRRQSMIIVPMDTPGVNIIREPTVFGYQDRGGHPEIDFENVRVPAANLLGEEGGGFAIAQARLGPGRIHHCMRAIGAAERCLRLMVERSKERVAFGRPLADQGVIREWIADARIEIEQTRLLVLKTAWMIDRMGTKAARTEIAAIKVAAPSLLTKVADRAIQLFGAAGFTEDFPLASLYSMGRWLQIADGPDEVHRRSVARTELRN
ncbi:MAG: acyl-CoA dehydrogenase [Actinobacteria bacterium]|nr:MAG: acyl-CoA dehydrogenase [Actinomycetota bacterium]REK39130.1 MAG: acyl-CoA dehydrogenase [Actinomycetota bacterium]